MVSAPAPTALEDMDVDAWVRDINAWIQSEVSDWLDHPHYDADRCHRGGEGLIGYANQSCMSSRTVVYNSWLTNGHPVAPGPGLAGALAGAGIRRVFSGHQPFGDHPLVMKAHGVKVVTADTSYSDVNADDNRGAAVASIVCNLDPSAPDTHITGRLACGAGFDFLVDADDLIGRHCYSSVGSEWITAYLPGSSHYVLRSGAGFDVSHRLVSPDEALAVVTSGV